MALRRRELSPRAERWVARTVAGAVVVAILAAVLLGAREGASGPLQLLYLASRSILRMGIAFVVSVAFAFSYGYAAATSKRAAKLLLPLLDVLQSVPILAFFPAAVLFFVALFNGSPIGLESASIFLIFTSQSWNMAFAVYESITSMPKETADAADVSGMKGWARVKRVTLPVTVPKLVYNGIFSWSGGWYFVTASEVISSFEAGGASIVLPGLGSYIFQAGERGDTLAMLAGIAVLVSSVVLFELLLWRPLQVVAERYKFEVGSVRGASRSRVLSFYRTMQLSLASRDRLRDVGERTGGQLRRLAADRRASRILRVARWLVTGIVGLFLVVAVGLLVAALVDAVFRPLTNDVLFIPLALLASTLRLAIAYVITLVWTIPLAIFIARKDRWSRVVLPLTEVMASIPAVAVFLLILPLVVRSEGGLGFASILLVLTGMQWYLLFNLIAGARAIPSDLLHAAEVEGVKGWLLWKRVYLPGMMPSLITGSITAWGGGWNALIVSEYVPYGGETFHAFGVGYLINKATFETRDTGLLLLSVVAMVVFIYCINVIVWKPLYRKALAKYQLEG